MYVDAKSVERNEAYESFSAACQSSGFDLEETFVTCIPVNETKLYLAVGRQGRSSFQQFLERLELLAAVQK